MKPKKMKRVSIRIPSDVHAALSKRAGKDKRSMVATLRVLLGL